MKALVLAGGYGTRLRPLSCTRPKLLFPIANRPILDLTLEKLAGSGIDEVILAVNFMAYSLEQAFKGSKHGMRLQYSRDSAVKDDSRVGMGTGGSVRHAEGLIGRDEPFIILNGDILNDFDYSEIIERQNEYGGMATIALHEVEDTSRYGVAEIDDENRIRKFVEKPKAKPPSNLANAGVYVCKPEIFDYIPKGKRCSIERDVFPILARKKTLFGHIFNGLWVDIGEPTDYLRANSTWLETKPEHLTCPESAIVNKTAKIKGTVALGENVTVNARSTIGPNVSIGKNSYLGEGVSVKNSIILPHTAILDLSQVTRAIIGEAVKIGRNVRVQQGCLIGDNTTLSDNITLARRVKVCPWSEISKDILTPGAVI